MKWFRNNVKHGSRLALFALAIQFALAFGHFHGFAVQAAIATGPTQANLDHAPDPAARATSNEIAKTPQPSPTDTDHATDTCAICAVISLANNLLLVTPPLLQLPQAVELLYLTTDAEFAHLSSLRQAFRSRAPPAS